jgi:hypothetical protein
MNHEESYRRAKRALEAAHPKDPKAPGLRRQMMLARLRANMDREARGRDPNGGRR